MDQLPVLALKEVALEGQDGCSLDTLWQCLTAHLPLAGISSLGPALKQHIWSCLLRHPADVQLFTPSGQFSAKEVEVGKPKKKTRGIHAAPPPCAKDLVASNDTAIQNLVSAAAMGIHMVASPEMRQAVLGLYDSTMSRFQVSEFQQYVLQLIGKTRKNGAIQAEMSTKLGVEHSNFYYIVKCLEQRNLVSRLPALLAPSKESGKVAAYYSNLLHLQCFAPNIKLGPHQMLKMETVGEGPNARLVPAAVPVADDAAYMSLICDTIAATEERVVSEGDLKMVLGFRAPRGHRLWRKLRAKLESLKNIECMVALVRGKSAPCLKLLKEFATAGHGAVEGGEDDGADEDEEGGEDTSGGGVRCMELPLDRQILDLIASCGADGILQAEIFAAMQINGKQNATRLTELVKRYRLNQLAVNVGRQIHQRLFASPELLEQFAAHSTGNIILQPQPATSPHSMSATHVGAPATSAGAIGNQDGSVSALMEAAHATSSAAVTSAAGTAHTAQSPAATPNPTALDTLAAAAAWDGGGSGGPHTQPSDAGASAGGHGKGRGRGRGRGRGAGKADTSVSAPTAAAVSMSVVPAAGAAASVAPAEPSNAAATSAAAAAPLTSHAQAEEEAVMDEDATDLDVSQQAQVVAGVQAGMPAGAVGPGGTRRAEMESVLHVCKSTSGRTKHLTMLQDDRLRRLTARLDESRYIVRAEVRTFLLDHENAAAAAVSAAAAASGRTVEAAQDEYNQAKARGSTLDSKTVKRLINKLEASGKLIRVVLDRPSGGTRIASQFEVALKPGVELTEDLKLEILETQTAVLRRLRQNVNAMLDTVREVVDAADPETAVPTASLRGTATEPADEPPMHHIYDGTVPGLPVCAPERRLFRVAGMRPGSMLGSQGHDMGGRSRVTLYNNGYVTAKMVRTKLLHYVICQHVGLGRYPTLTNDAGRASGDLEQPEAPSNVRFTMEKIFGLMSFDLALQVVGCPHELPQDRLLSFIQRQRPVMKVAQLNEAERIEIFGARYVGRLAYSLDILRRLQLVQLVSRPGRTQPERAAADGAMMTVNEVGLIDMPRKAAAWGAPPGPGIPDPDVRSTSQDTLPPASADTSKADGLNTIAEAAAITATAGEGTTAGPEDLGEGVEANLNHAVAGAAGCEIPAETAGVSAAAVKTGGTAAAAAVDVERVELQLNDFGQLDRYWELLEWVSTCALEDRVQRKHTCIPDKDVPEVLSQPVWSSNRAMPVEIWLRLTQALDCAGSQLEYDDAEALADQLNLQPEQVMRLAFDRMKRLEARTRYSAYDSALPGAATRKRRGGPLERSKQEAKRAREQQRAEKREQRIAKLRKRKEAEAHKMQRKQAALLNAQQREAAKKERAKQRQKRRQEKEAQREARFKAMVLKHEARLAAFNAHVARDSHFRQVIHNAADQLLAALFLPSTVQKELVRANVLAHAPRPPKPPQIRRRRLPMPPGPDDISSSESDDEDDSSDDGSQDGSRSPSSEEEVEEEEEVDEGQMNGHVRRVRIRSHWKSDDDRRMLFTYIELRLRYGYIDRQIPRWELALPDTLPFGPAPCQKRYKTLRLRWSHIFNIMDACLKAAYRQIQPVNAPSAAAAINGLTTGGEAADAGGATQGKELSAPQPSAPAELTTSPSNARPDAAAAVVQLTADGMAASAADDVGVVPNAAAALTSDGAGKAPPSANADGDDQQQQSVPVADTPEVNVQRAVECAEEILALLPRREGTGAKKKPMTSLSGQPIRRRRRRNLLSAGDDHANEEGYNLSSEAEEEEVLVTPHVPSRHAANRAAREVSAAGTAPWSSSADGVGGDAGAQVASPLQFLLPLMLTDDVRAGAPPRNIMHGDPEAGTEATATQAAAESSVQPTVAVSTAREALLSLLTAAQDASPAACAAAAEDLQLRFSSRALQAACKALVSAGLLTPPHSSRPLVMTAKCRARCQPAGYTESLLSDTGAAGAALKTLLHKCQLTADAGAGAGAGAHDRSAQHASTCAAAESVLHGTCVLDVAQGAVKVLEEKDVGNGEEDERCQPARTVGSLTGAIISAILTSVALGRAVLRASAHSTPAAAEVDLAQAAGAVPGTGLLATVQGGAVVSTTGLLCTRVNLLITPAAGSDVMAGSGPPPHDAANEGDGGHRVGGEIHASRAGLQCADVPSSHLVATIEASSPQATAAATTADLVLPAASTTMALDPMLDPELAEAMAMALSDDDEGPPAPHPTQAPLPNSMPESAPAPTRSEGVHSDCSTATFETGSKRRHGEAVGVDSELQDGICELELPEGLSQTAHDEAVMALLQAVRDAAEAGLTAEQAADLLAQVRFMAHSHSGGDGADLAGSAVGVAPVGNLTASGPCLQLAQSALQELVSSREVRKIHSQGGNVYVAAEHSQQYVLHPRQCAMAALSTAACEGIETAVVVGDTHQPTSEASALAATAAAATATAAKEIARDAVMAAQQAVPVGGAKRRGISAAAFELLVRPWLDHEGYVNRPLLLSLVQRVLAYVMRKPGVTEASLIAHLDCLLSANATELLQFMLDAGLITTRSIPIATPTRPRLLRLVAFGEVGPGNSGAHKHEATAGAAKWIRHFFPVLERMPTASDMLGIAPARWCSSFAGEARLGKA